MPTPSQRDDRKTVEGLGSRPLPFSAGSADIGKPLCLYDANGDAIALMSSREGKEELALFIVRAVNAHADLVATCKIARTYILADQERMKIGASMHADDPDTAGLLREWISVSNEKLKVIRDALLKAGEKV